MSIEWADGCNSTGQNWSLGEQSNPREVVEVKLEVCSEKALSEVFPTAVHLFEHHSAVLATVLIGDDDRLQMPDAVEVAAVE